MAEVKNVSVAITGAIPWKQNPIYPGITPISFAHHAELLEYIIKIQESLDALTLSTMALQYKPRGDLKKQVGSIKDLNLNQDIVYIFKNKTVQPVIITKGLSDVSNVEIIDGLKEGDKIIVEQINNFKGKSPKK